MLLNDVRYAVRLLRRSPLFTLTVFFTVALAIGANTAILSVVNAVLLRRLPFRDPGHLVQIAEKNDRLNLPSFGASVLNFLSWREQQKSFEQIAAVGFATYTLTGNGEPEQLTGTPISPALTRVLGVAPILGRDFSDAEEKPGAPAVAMISPGLWKRRFGGERSIIGSSILLNGKPTTIVGIAPGEIGLRVALGATRGQVLKLILGEGMRIVVGGIAIGVVAELALGRVLSGLVYGVRVHDPVIFSSVVVILATVALAACALPAMRAARVQPMTALRYE